MKVSSINSYYTYSAYGLYSQNPQNRKKPQNIQINFSGSSISDEKYRSAKEYADYYKNQGYYERYGYSIDDLNLDKLDGIQKDIDVFDGMSMKDIYYTFYNLNGILVRRGCSNQCGHCFVGALPPIRENGEYINSMPYEDYVGILDGVKELNKRIGTSIFSNDYLVKSGKMMSLFFDADCMEIALRDKNGKLHEFPELVDKYYDTTGETMLFDTASWNHKNPVMQKRAEDIVEYLSNPNNSRKVSQINLSLSPFHSFYMKSLEFMNAPIKRKERKEKSNALYNMYIDRMSNMLVTFSPLIDNPNFNIIARPLKNGIPNMKDFGQKTYEHITEDIINATERKLYDKYSDENKYSRDEVVVDDLVNRIINVYKQKIGLKDNNLIMSGKFEKLFKSKNPKMSELDIMSYFPNYVSKRPDGKPKYEAIYNIDGLSRYIDANGRVYLTDYVNIIPTELQLNLSVKDKRTRDFGSIIRDDKLVTKSRVQQFNPNDDNAY